MMRRYEAEIGPLRESGEVARLDGVCVRYRVPQDRHVTIKEFILRGGRREHRDYLALDGLDLSVARGEVVGVIGRNGAGKTTLLKVIARILRPTSGRLRLAGRVASLIDLVGPFHLELTGRENARMAAAVMGLSGSEIEHALPSIESFCELGSFFDAPMRTWSAGMMVRLGFSVATSADADLLAVDEALGVGDAAFQKKCAQRISDFRTRGTSFVVVSHDVHRLVEMSDRILWLEGGRLRMSGRPADVVAAYLEQVDA